MQRKWAVSRSAVTRVAMGQDVAARSSAVPIETVSGESGAELKAGCRRVCPTESKTGSRTITRSVWGSKQCVCVTKRARKAGRRPANGRWVSKQARKLLKCRGGPTWPARATRQPRWRRPAHSAFLAVWIWVLCRLRLSRAGPSAAAHRRCAWMCLLSGQALPVTWSNPAPRAAGRAGLRVVPIGVSRFAPPFSGLSRVARVQATRRPARARPLARGMRPTLMFGCLTTSRRPGLSSSMS